MKNQRDRKVTQIAPLMMLVLFSLVCSILTLAPQTVTAQRSPTSWSEPIHLAGAVDFETWQPRIVADEAGNLHVIWLAWVGTGQPQRLVANTIYYSRWNGEYWTQPIDILTVTGSDRLSSSDLVVTPDGLLFIAWESNGNAFISSASASSANDARSWTTSSLGPGLSPKIAYDPETQILYLTLSDSDLQQVDLLSSTDFGQSWQQETVVWNAYDSASSISNEDLSIDSEGNIHSVWVQNAEQRNWQGETVWHALLAQNGGELTVRSVMSSDDPEDPTLGGPSLIYLNDGTAYLFWNNGIGSSTGRFYAASSDNGLTWSEPKSLFPGLSGQTGSPGIAIDSSGRLHLATSAADAGTDYGVVRYSEMEEGIWSEYETLPLEKFVGEHPSLVITDGNLLHLVWTQFEKINDSSFGRVSYSSLAVDAPLVSPTPLIGVSLLHSSIDGDGLTSTDAELAKAPEPSQTVQPNNEDLSENLRQKPLESTSQETVLLTSVIPAFFLLLLVIVILSRRAT